jgi:hypothetical protein
MSSQHGDELRALADRAGQAQAQAARRAQARRRAQAACGARAQAAGQAARPARPEGPGLAPRARRRRFRRRTGWALVALGLRLAYAAGED